MRFSYTPPELLVCQSLSTVSSDTAAYSIGFLYVMEVLNKVAKIQNSVQSPEGGP